ERAPAVGDTGARLDRVVERRRVVAAPAAVDRGLMPEVERLVGRRQAELAHRDREVGRCGRAGQDAACRGLPRVARRDEAGAWNPREAPMKFDLLYELQIPKPHDERSEYRCYQEALAQIELADRLGFDTVWEVEHHFLTEFAHSS